MKLADVAVIPWAIDLDAIFKSGAAYAAISLSVTDLLHHVGYEQPLADPDFWTTARVWSTERPLGGENCKTRRRDIPKSRSKSNRGLGAGWGLPTPDYNRSVRYEPDRCAASWWDIQCHDAAPPRSGGRA
jgi:hypothetical protein